MAQTPLDEVTSPKLYATVIGLAGATLAFIVALVFLMPFGAFGMVSTRDSIFIAIGMALWIFSVAFMYGLLRHCRKCYERALAGLVTGQPETQGQAEEDLGEEDSPIGEGLGEDFIKVKGTPKSVRLTDGVTREMLAELAEADLPAVSQRALDSAGIVTRDPSVAVNAKILVVWLARNDFIRLIGNNRYEFTPLGHALLKTVGGTSSTPPPTTTVE